MEDKDKRIQELFDRIEKLSRQQKVFHDEIYRLYEDLKQLRASAANHMGSSPEQTPAPSPEPQVSRPVVAAEKVARFEDRQRAVDQEAPAPQVSRQSKSAWEDFIGTNLLNKVGIAVLVIGVAFGTKYSIDNDLIDPLTRIVLGYLSGVVLTGIALRLREGHPGFSAVLLSGGMAVFYFITYAAYSFYDLIPQIPAFMLMVMFTVFTVFASLRYNMEVISIIALVGAYAVPLLLSDGSGRVVVLFTYITIINTGILVLAFHRYWKRLYYLAFALTWLTFASWFSFTFYKDHQTTISLIFSSVFFITFYVTFLAHKLLRREALGRGDVISMLVNSFVFYGFGYLSIASLPEGEQYLGLFTLLTAVVHFVACMLIYKTQARASDIFYFVAGMVLVFLTIAVPVQLEGNWVTLVWASEATLMFWIGRSKGLATYEKISYPLIGLAFVSLLHDWSHGYPGSYYYMYEHDPDHTIFFNINFLTSMLVAGTFAAIFFFHNRHPDSALEKSNVRWPKLVTDTLPVLVLAILYIGFYKEIEAYWYNLYAGSRLTIQGDDSVDYDQYNHYLLHLKNIWLLIFSAVFAGVFSLIVKTKWQTRPAVLGGLALNALVLLAFVSTGLLELSSLRMGFLDQDLAAYYDVGSAFVVIRYVAIVVLLPVLWLSMKLLATGYPGHDLLRSGHLYLHLVVLALLSSELLHWLDMARMENSLKLSLSILWGIYALFMIVYGLSRDLKHIRIGGIVLFAATLLKLFAYDMADMSTILKTVVMIILGALLLTASFIYNKFKRSAGNEAP